MGVRQARGLSGIGFAVNAAVLAAEKPRPKYTFDKGDNVRINATLLGLSKRELEERYAAEGARISHLDGVSVDFDDWHFNVRPSNTEPLLRLNLEARTKERMEHKRDEVLAEIDG
mgnify:CR=1 FL=1